MERTRFEKQPVVKVEGIDHQAIEGWSAIVDELFQRIKQKEKGKNVIVVETYQGVFYEVILQEIKNRLLPGSIIDSRNAMYPGERIGKITQPDVTTDRVFGYMTRLKMQDFFDENKLKAFQNEVENVDSGTVLIIGPGASLIAPSPDVLVYADMARWEIQLRMRKNQVDNLGIDNKEDSPESQYKRGYFVDWRVCDKLKKQLIDRWDYVLDTNRMEKPVMVDGESVREGLRQAVQQPFSVVPYFDAGPWGGQWMKEICELDPDKPNYAWSINCIPEENSLLLDYGNAVLELPSINLVFYKPEELLGNAVHGRFGPEFPIRFDFLDTMDGGNLSLQVHPTTEYIQETFGMHYTQDESYYLMDADGDASVYLGLKDGVNPEEMMTDLKKAEKEKGTFDDSKYVEKWPAKKHDHFLIPAGTVHCSGRNSMVLEISSTPYIFTFKLYDWGRLGLDGKPRPINIKHGENVIQWGRTTEWTRKNLINRIEEVERGEGWREERTGLHEKEFLETRRHWFTKKVTHDTKGNLNVLNLVKGREVVVESPGGAFKPFLVHYAETFIIPASVGKYTIRPYGVSEGEECATVKAYVRVS
ncbi:MAG: class I mannose-6-phosphate isomerase [Bacteroidales bacterium]|nr:class I mannose-6-phosphate isomerase [Bacteroidales bacterium]MCF8332926.1 class I mannose-6-phosphate isomerase [Bacteroidales bacterium]